MSTGPADGDPGGLFRGSERPRWLVLLGVMVAGWAAVGYYIFLRPAPRPPAEPAPSIADAPPLPPADPDLAFRTVTDLTPLGLRDMAAYKLLIERARDGTNANGPPRRDVLFSQLIRRPERYRGLPIHLQGTARRVVRLDDVSTTIAPGGRLYEAWVYTNDSRGYPYLFVFEAPPPGLPGGDDVHELVAFDGAFLKLMGYSTGTTRNAAPLLVGRLRLVAEPGRSRAGAARSWLWTFAPFALFLVYLAARVAWRISQALRPRPRRRPLAFPPTDEISPDALARFVEPPDDPDPKEPWQGDDWDDESPSWPPLKGRPG